jgi:hypothetical protein
MQWSFDIFREGRAVNTIIDNSCPHVNGWKREAAQIKLNKEGIKSSNHSVRNSVVSHASKDVVGIKGSLGNPIVAGQEGFKHPIKDFEEAQRLVQEIIGQLGSEAKKKVEYLYNLDTERLARFL